MGLEPESVSRMVDILGAAGWSRGGAVLRRHAATNVTLTDEGLELTAAAKNAGVRLRAGENLLAPLSDDGVRVLAGIMGRLLRDAGRLPEAEPPGEAGPPAGRRRAGLSKAAAGAG